MEISRDLRVFVGISGDQSEPAGICGDLSGSVGTCRYLWGSVGPAGICRDLQGSAGIYLASRSETFCNLVAGPHVCPRPTAISPGQNSLQDWTDYDS